MSQSDCVRYVRQNRKDAKEFFARCVARWFPR